MGLFGKSLNIEGGITPPHCDARVLHAPDDGCQYCNMQPEWQQLRELWGINFTGHHDGGKILCPAEQARPLESINRWGGNTADGDGAGFYEYRGLLPTKEEVEAAIAALQQTLKDME